MSIDTLSIDKIEKFIVLVNKGERFKLDSSPLLALEKLRYVTNGHPSWAAILMFADDPLRHHIHIGRFKIELKRRALEGCLPKAVVLIHLYGQPADIETIKELCDKYEVVLIEDAAEALGAEYKGKSPGTFGLAGFYAFNGNKIITTSGGSMIVSDNEQLIEKVKFWSTQARDNVMHYEHSEVGYNYRMSNVLAAIGRGQLRVLSERVARKRQIYEQYREKLGDLPGITFMPEPDFARPTWKPMHMQPIYKEYQVVGGSVAEHLFTYGLCLPSGTNMSEEELARVISIVRKCWK